MNILNWNSIKQVLSDKSTLGLHMLFIFMMIYAISTGGDHQKIKLFLLCLGLSVVVLFVKKINQPLLWYMFLMLFANDLIFGYFVRANHHFFLVYITVVTIIYLHNHRLEVFLTNIKLLLAIVLLFSGIQKLLSPQFISGDFYYYMINTGRFFKPILYFNQDMNDIISNNKSLISQLNSSEPNNLQFVTLQNIYPKLDLFSRGLAWVSIILEFLVAILILFRPKHIMTHIVFIVVVTGIFLTRLESGFLALLAICGIWLTDNYKIRAIYLALTILFFSLIITKIGFY